MVRVHNFMVSSDGYGAGEGQSLERPFGHADPAQLGAWAFATASWPNRTDPGGSRGSTTTWSATSTDRLSDTTFHFVGGDPATVLQRAFEAADGKDVRLGGGAKTIRQFLDADLIDTLHVAVAPVELGAGSRLWNSPEELLERYHCDVVPSPTGVVHHLFWRR